MIKRAGEHEFEYKYLFLDVKGEQRIYLENTDASPKSAGKGTGKVFGIQWTR
jgi:mitochondrial import inner membrane translocase subunit TIM21